MFKNSLITVLGIALGSLLYLQHCTAAIPPTALNHDQPTLAPMLKQVTPSVVNIATEGEVEVAGNPLLNDPFFRRFFDFPETPRQRKTSAIGSGVIVDADKGYIVTNEHVIANANTIKVRLNDDREFEAELIGSDDETDLALLQIKAENLKSLPIADSDQLQVGDFVVAVGNPFGLRQTVTSGIVSGLGRHGLGKRYENFVQTDASINPGNSGGALINLSGELVGINTAILSRSGGNIGIGFAIPTNLMRVVMNQILEYGEVQRGQLGIIGQDLTPELAKAFDLDVVNGVVIAQVLPDTAADKVGLKSGDIITHVNGKKIREFAQLRNAIGLLRVGDDAKIRVLRDGKAKTYTATIESPKDVEVSSEQLHEGLKGASFSNISPDHPLANVVQGVVVTEVEAGSPAAQYGLRPGDVITSVNRQKVDDLEDFRELTDKKDGRLLLHIRRGRGALFILVS